MEGVQENNASQGENENTVSNGPTAVFYRNRNIDDIPIFYSAQIQSNQLPNSRESTSGGITVAEENSTFQNEHAPQGRAEACYSYKNMDAIPAFEDLNENGSVGHGQAELNSEMNYLEQLAEVPDYINDDGIRVQKLRSSNFLKNAMSLGYGNGEKGHPVNENFGGNGLLRVADKNCGGSGLLQDPPSIVRKNSAKYKSPGFRNSNNWGGNGQRSDTSSIGKSSAGKNSTRQDPSCSKNWNEIDPYSESRTTVNQRAGTRGRSRSQDVREDLVYNNAYGLGPAANILPDSRGFAGSNIAHNENACRFEQTLDDQSYAKKVNSEGTRDTTAYTNLDEYTRMVHMNNGYRPGTRNQEDLNLAFNYAFPQEHSGYANSHPHHGTPVTFGPNVGANFCLNGSPGVLNPNVGGQGYTHAPWGMATNGLCYGPPPAIVHPSLNGMPMLENQHGNNGHHGPIPSSSGFNKAEPNLSLGQNQNLTCMKCLQPGIHFHPSPPMMQGRAFFPVASRLLLTASPPKESQLVIVPLSVETTYDSSQPDGYRRRFVSNKPPNTHLALHVNPDGYYRGSIEQCETVPLPVGCTPQPQM